MNKEEFIIWLESNGFTKEVEDVYKNYVGERTPWGLLFDLLEIVDDSVELQCENYNSEKMDVDTNYEYFDTFDDFVAAYKTFSHRG